MDGGQDTSGRRRTQRNRISNGIFWILGKKGIHSPYPLCHTLNTPEKRRLEAHA